MELTRDFKGAYIRIEKKSKDDIYVRKKK